MKHEPRASARFTVRNDGTLEIPGSLSFRTLKRRERRAPELARVIKIRYGDLPRKFPAAPTA
ncbi:MAG TPA: hypothetical protein VF437_11360 [Verrucomicrobiae bacterium]|jgi:hypothetical protein